MMTLASDAVVASIRTAADSYGGPLSARLARALREAIDGGLLPPGSALPAERTLAAGLGVSRSTLRDCLAELGAEGRLETRHGFGTVVTGAVNKALSRLSGFSEDIRARGRHPSSRVVERTIGPVPSEVAFRTGLPLGTPVMTLARQRLADDEVMSFERSVVPLAVVGEDFDGTGSLYDRMGERGLRPARILQSLVAVAASPSVAEMLEVSAGAAVLEIAQVGYGPGGAAVEDFIGWYRGDRYRYVGEIVG